MTVKRYFFTALIVTFLLCPYNKIYANVYLGQGLPNTTEALENLLQTNLEDEQKLKIYNKLYKLNRDTDFSLAINYLLKETEIADNLGDHLVKGKACYNTGILYRKLGDYSKAVDSYLDAINEYEVIGDTARLGVVWNNLANVFLILNNYPRAIKYFEKSNFFYFKSGDYEGQVLSNYNLGVSYFAKKEPNLDSSEYYLRKALILLPEVSDEKRKDFYNDLQTRLGVVSYMRDNYTDAIQYYQSALDLVTPTDSDADRKYLIAYANIAEAYTEKGDYSKAEEWITKAKPLIEKIEDENLVVGVYNIFGKFHQKQDDHISSIEMFEMAIKSAGQNNVSEDLTETFKLARLSYEKLIQSGQNELANKYDNLLLLDLYDKTNLEAQSKAIELAVQLEDQIQSKRREAEKNVQANNISFLLGILLIVVLISSFLMFLYYKKVKRSRDYWRNTGLKVGRILDSISKK